MPADRAGIKRHRDRRSGSADAPSERCCTGAAGGADGGIRRRCGGICGKAQLCDALSAKDRCRDRRRLRLRGARRLAGMPADRAGIKRHRNRRSGSADAPSERCRTGAAGGARRRCGGICGKAQPLRCSFGKDCLPGAVGHLDLGLPKVRHAPDKTLCRNRRECRRGEQRPMAARSLTHGRKRFLPWPGESGKIRTEAPLPPPRRDRKQAPACDCTDNRQDL